MDLNTSNDSKEASVPVQPEKRIKLDSDIDTCIVDLCARGLPTTFKGDVLVTYGPASSRNLNSPAKAKLFHADLTDCYGQMTISVTITNTLIDRFKAHISKGSSVSISDFVLKQKTIFERGDADVCIHLTDASTVENIPLLCNARKLVPNTTIHELRASTNDYSVGSVAALVTHSQQSNCQYCFSIKDGETENDTATLKLGESFEAFFFQVQRQLVSESLPLYLFKNIVRNGPHGSRSLRGGLSTFCDQLNHSHAITHLKSLCTTKP